MFWISTFISGAICAAYLIFLKAGKKFTIIFSVIIAFLFGFSSWALMPSVNFHFASFWWLPILLFLVIWGIPAVYESSSEGCHDPLFEKNGVFGFVISMALLAIFLVVSLFSSPVFKSKQYAEMLPTPKISKFSDDVSPVDIKKMRQVTKTLANLLAEKKLGEMPGLGSRAAVGSMNLQLVNGSFNIINGSGEKQKLVFENDLVWAGPLIHSGFSKQLSHKSTPGYILVSATDPSVVHFVTHIQKSSVVQEKNTDRMGDVSITNDDFEELSLQYLSEGAYFGSLVQRHLYTNGYHNVGLTDFSFEISDDGRPFYVVTKFKKQIGFYCPEATGVIIVDSQNGKIEEYTIDNTPSWVDRIQPENFVTDQINWQGKYKLGFWNSLFAKKDVFMTTPGMSLVYGADGQSYWYTGIQSVGADQSTMGFVLVNTRTKDFRWYQISGANETAAKTSAQSAPGVREAEFRASAPILYNVLGEPTYFMTLHGDDGLVKMFSFVNVKDYQVLGVGRSIDQALKDYQTSLVNLNRSTNIDDLVERKTIEDTVKQIVTEGDFYFFLLENHTGEFYASSSLSPKIKWTQPGQKITITIQEANSYSTSIIEFLNSEIDF